MLPNNFVLNYKSPLESNVADSSIGLDRLARARSNSVLTNFPLSVTSVKNLGALLGFLVRFWG